MPKSPEVFLRHILDEIQYLQTLRHLDDGYQLKSDPTLSRAVVRSLEIIGEAANNISNIVVNILNEEIAPLKDKISPLLDSFDQ